MNLKIILVVLSACLAHTTFAESTYILSANSAIQTTTSGVQLFGIPAKDFVAKGFNGQVEYIKNSTILHGAPYILGLTGRVNGSKNDDIIIAGSRVFQVWGRAGNDVMIANGRKHTFSGGPGIDTVLFPGKLQDYIITGDKRWVQVKNSITGAHFKVSSQDIEQYQFDDAFFGSEAGANVLSVGPKSAFRKVADATGVAGKGDTIVVEKGDGKDLVGGPSSKFVGIGNVTSGTANEKMPNSNTSNGDTSSSGVGVIEKDGEFQSPARLDQYKGNIITVGRGKQYSSLKDAVSKSASGDIIYVDEGVYLSDYVMIDSKNIAIIGLGKGAEFRKVAPIPNGKAIFVSYRSNVLIKNIIFSDSDVPDDNGAGIRYEGGTLTIVDSLFRNNENGILGGATEVGKGRIWIHNSRFIDNGKNATGYTHSIYIGEIDFFEIKNSTVSGTRIGHHVKSRARNNIIENNILDDAGKDTSYNIDLPNGGDALVRGNTIIQSAQSPNRNMVSYSAEKNPTNPGRLIVENNIFTSQGGSATGVKNFKNNTVLLINNTFNNVSSKFSGINITEK